jgi:hypothetical protein
MRGRTTSSLVLLLVLAVGGLAIPTAVVACDCVSPEDQLRGAGRDPRTVILTGTPGVETPAGVPVSVSRWFLGTGAAPVVLLRVESAESNTCRTTAPPAGREHLFVLWREDGGDLLFHLCSVAADLGTDDGQARLAQAEALLGPGATTEPVGAAPSSSPEAAIVGIASGVFAPLVMVVVVGVAFLLGIVAVLRRTRVERDD